MKFTLSARPPFNFLSVVNSHGWRQLAPFSYDEESNTLSYVLRLSGGRVVELKLRDAGDGVLVETETLAKGERREVTENVTWMLGLDMDFARFYAAARKEPKLAHVKKRALGRILRSPTLFEDVIKTILTTNTLWTATKNMTRKLVDVSQDVIIREDDCGTSNGIWVQSIYEGEDEVVKLGEESVT